MYAKAWHVSPLCLACHNWLMLWPAAAGHSLGCSEQAAGRLLTLLQAAWAPWQASAAQSLGRMWQAAGRLQLVLLGPEPWLGSVVSGGHSCALGHTAWKGLGLQRPGPFLTMCPEVRV